MTNKIKTPYPIILCFLGLAGCSQTASKLGMKEGNEMQGQRANTISTTGSNISQQQQTAQWRLQHGNHSNSSLPAAQQPIPRKTLLSVPSPSNNDHNTNSISQNSAAQDGFRPNARQNILSDNSSFTAVSNDGGSTDVRSQNQEGFLSVFNGRKNILSDNSSFTAVNNDVSSTDMRSQNRGESPPVFNEINELENYLNENSSPYDPFSVLRNTNVSSTDMRSQNHHNNSARSDTNEQQLPQRNDKRGWGCFNKQACSIL